MLDGICAEVIVERFDLPEPLPVGVDVSADVDLRLDLGGVPVEAPFQVQVYGQVECAGPVSSCEGRSDAAGVVTAVVRRVDDSQNYRWLAAKPVLPLFSPEGGLTLATVPIFGQTSLFRGSVRVLSGFTEIVAPGVPAEMRLLVDREVAPDAFGPLANAVITCSVSGGDADPAIVITDEAGFARTMITADAGVDSVVVDVVVTDRGIAIWRDRATAQVAEGAIVNLVSWRVIAVAGASSTYNTESCPPDHVEEISAGFGPVSASAVAGNSCSFENMLGEVTVLSSFSSASVNADPGLAPGHAGATMTFNGFGSATAQVSGPFISGMQALGVGLARLDFSFDVVGGSMEVDLQGLTGRDAPHELLAVAAEDLAGRRRRRARVQALADHAVDERVVFVRDAVGVLPPAALARDLDGDVRGAGQPVAFLHDAAVVALLGIVLDIDVGRAEHGARPGQRHRMASVASPLAGSVLVPVAVVDLDVFFVLRLALDPGEAGPAPRSSRHPRACGSADG